MQTRVAETHSGFPCLRHAADDRPRSRGDESVDKRPHASGSGVEDLTAMDDDSDDDSDDNVILSDLKREACPNELM